MSDDQQPEDLRPIPDGGLKDSMPGWLKRPPAWRSMPTAEQRHERTLPEPDTSEIDPKTLVDVNDLPQWLQTIAARGEVPVPEPDETVGHALQQVQAAKERSREPLPDLEDVADERPDEAPSPPEITEDPPNPVETTETTTEIKPSEPVVKNPPPAESGFLKVALVFSFCIIVIALVIGAFTLL